MPHRFLVIPKLRWAHRPKTSSAQPVVFLQSVEVQDHWFVPFRQSVILQNIMQNNKRATPFTSLQKKNCWIAQHSDVCHKAPWMESFNSESCKSCYTWSLEFFGTSLDAKFLQFGLWMLKRKTRRMPLLGLWLKNCKCEFSTTKMLSQCSAFFDLDLWDICGWNQTWNAFWLLSCDPIRLLPGRPNFFHLKWLSEENRLKCFIA